MCRIHSWGAASTLLVHSARIGQKWSKPILTQNELEFKGGSSESLGVNFDEESKYAIIFKILLMHKT